MAYTFQKLANGNVEIYENGKAISTGSGFAPTYAAGVGYKESAPAVAPATPKAPVSSGSVPANPDVSSAIADITKKINELKPKVEAFKLSTSNASTGTQTNPTLPPPTVDNANNTATSGIAAQLAASQKAYDDLLAKNKEAAAQQVEMAKTKVDTGLGEYKQVTAENANKINSLSSTYTTRTDESYKQRVKITSELESILTQINDANIASNQTTGLSAIQGPRASQTVSELTGRATVLSSVLQAVDGNISAAGTILNNGIGAVQAASKDTIDYYRMVIDMNNNNLITLKANEKAYADAQIASAETKLANSQKTYDYVREMMLDPAKAAIIASAGVTLNDSVEEINAKIAKYVTVQDTESKKNDLTLKGYEYVPFPTADKTGLVSFNINGQEYWFKKPLEDEWSAPYNMGGDIVQKNLKTGEIKVAVNVDKVTSSGGGLNIADYPSNSQNSALVNAFNSAVINLPKAQMEVATNTFNNFLNSGNTEGAKNYLVSMAMSGASVDQQNQAVGRTETIAALTNIKELLSSVPTNLLKGNIENIVQKLGESSDPDLAYIRSQIQQQVQTYRRAMTGVAFSPQESAEYAKIFPDISNGDKLNTTKVDALLSSLNRNNRSVLSFYLGGSSNYDAIFGKDQADILPSKKVENMTDTEITNNLDSIVGETTEPQKTWFDQFLGVFGLTTKK